MVLTSVPERRHGMLKLVFFNQPCLGRSLKIGDRLLAFGPR